MPAHQTTFSSCDLNAIHQASLEIMTEIGIAFPSSSTRDLFHKHGFKIDGEKVFINQNQLEGALKSAPSGFKIRARNPERDLQLGGEYYVLAATASATQIMDMNKESRPSTINDYHKFARLVQTSDINMPTSHQICYPQDLNPATAHLDMYWADITMTDRVLTGGAASVDKIKDFLELLNIVFGSSKDVEKGPCSITVINPCTPLKYSADQSESLILLASRNQPVAVTNMMMLGATAPISVPAALALGNAEILAGIVLAQLVRPGVAVIYGGTSCPMDMKTMVAVLGNPETTWLSRGTQALADYYQLPCRTGGSLTDAHMPDAQALLEGTMVFYNALTNGAHFIMHSFGMMGSYMGVGFEKFVIDEEMARMAMASLKVPAVDAASLQLDLIKRLGSEGDYLTQASTVKGCKRLFRAKFLNKAPYSQWLANGGLNIAEQAKLEVERRINKWEKPPLEARQEKELIDFMDKRGVKPVSLN